MYRSLRGNFVTQGRYPRTEQSIQSNRSVGVAVAIQPPDAAAVCGMAEKSGESASKLYSALYLSYLSAAFEANTGRAFVGPSELDEVVGSPGVGLTYASTFRAGKVLPGSRGPSSAKSRAMSASSWRSGGGSVTSGVSSSCSEGSVSEEASIVSGENTDGRCYSRLAAVGGRLALRKLLRSWPSVGRVLAAPAGLFDLQRMRDCALVKTAGSLWHVSLQDPSMEYNQLTGAVSAADAFSRCVRDNYDVLQIGARRWKGSLAEELLKLPVALGSYETPSLDHAVGGLSGEHGPSVRCPRLLSSGYRSVFLAGSMHDDESGLDWRDGLAQALGDMSVVTYDPRQGDFSRVEDKWKWEFDAMRSSDVVFFNFQAGTTSSLSLLELGSARDYKRVVVRCDKEFRRFDYVRWFCESRSIPFYYDYGSAAGTLERMLRDT